MKTAINRKTVWLVLMVIFISLQAPAQEKFPLRNDTVIVIVDTTHSFVKFTRLTFDSISREILTFNARVSSRYMDEDFPKMKDRAYVGFVNRFDLDNLINHPYAVFIRKDVLFKSAYRIKDDVWINRQMDMNVLGRELGNFAFVLYNFLIFKQDLEDDKEYVPMHRVAAVIHPKPEY